MLGKALLTATHKSFQVIPTDARNIGNITYLDITSSQSLSQVNKLKPDIIINLAAYTNVDECETDKANAYKINTLGVKNLASICKELDVPMLHISTDYIFDGTKPTPYLEWDEPSPISIYGETKAESEIWVKQILEKYWIVRSSGLYGKGGENFVDTIISNAKEKGVLKVVTDQIGSPTYTVDLADAIVKLINTDCYGIYHVTNSDWCSWYDFAKTAFEFANVKCEIIPILSDEINRPAKRPKNFRLLNFMWENSMFQPLRPWQVALKEYIRSL